MGASAAVQLQGAAVTLLELTSMLAAGASLSYGDLLHGLRQWRPLLATISLNCLALPAFAWSLVHALSHEELAIAQALLITAASPGGGTGPVLALHARADVPLSVVLTFALALVSSLSTPFSLELFQLVAADANGYALTNLLRPLALYQLVPLVVGMAMRSRAPRVASMMANVCSKLALALLLLLGLVLLRELYDALRTTSAVAWATLLLTSIAGILGSHWMLSSGPRSAAIALTTTVRNCALSLMIAARWTTHGTVVAVLQFALVMYAVALSYTFFVRSRQLSA
jgi:bile acid:Na+ symporter, BASS family